MSWPLLLLACAGCYGFKALGALVPRRWLDKPALQDGAPLLPVALLVSLIVVNTVGADRRLVLDARLAGMAVAVVAIIRKLPFLAVVVLAAATTAGVRALAG